MLYIIDEKICISCGLCADVCPVEAINPHSATYRIDPELCIGCGECADSCPVQAIQPADH